MGLGASARIGGRREPAQLRVGFLLAHNFTLSALSLFVDALRLAADEGDRSRPIHCSWAVMSAHPEPIRSSCGLQLYRTSPLVDPKEFDYVVIVGGVLHAGEQVDKASLDYLRAAADKHVTLIGVCTGSFILARAGLMQDRRCCVSWYHFGDFRAEFPSLTPDADRLFIVDRDRITCAGGSGVADLAAFLIDRHVGKAAAQKSLHVLQMRDARAGSDAQPHRGLEAADDERVRRAILVMEQHIAEPLAIDAIAGKLRISSRHLERLFHEATGHSPATVYRNMRLHYARGLLETTRKSVTEVALEAGFSDGSHFARQFRTFFGAPPRAVRRRSPAPEVLPS